MSWWMQCLAFFDEAQWLTHPKSPASTWQLQSSVMKNQSAVIRWHPLKIIEGRNTSEPRMCRARIAFLQCELKNHLLWVRIMSYGRQAEAGSHEGFMELNQAAPAGQCNARLPQQLLKVNVQTATANGLKQLHLLVNSLCWFQLRFLEDVWLLRLHDDKNKEDHQILVQKRPPACSKDVMRMARPSTPRWMTWSRVWGWEL